MSVELDYQGISGLFNMSTANVHTSGGERYEGATGAIEEQGEAPVVGYGMSRASRFNASLFPGVDIKVALSRPISIHATSNAVMSAAEAGDMTVRLLSGVDLDQNLDQVKYGFVRAMCLCMAMNSSSTLVPGRAKFGVGPAEFDFFVDVMQPLGNDARRYFRAYADVTRQILQEIHREYQGGKGATLIALGEDASDEEVEARFASIYDTWNAIMVVANNRGLTRCPDLVHDSAEFCTGLTAVEMQFVKQSKATIFATGDYRRNVVDHPIVARTSASAPVGAVNSNNMPDDY